MRKANNKPDPRACPKCLKFPCGCPPGGGSGSDDGEPETVASTLLSMEEMLSQAHIPGIAIAYCRQDQTKTLAAGVIDTSSAAPIDDLTLFQAASLSKPVSAAIVLQLVEQGLWDLDKPLSDYKDYAQYATHSPESFRAHPHYHKLTTRMVIAQCSGLPNWFSGDAEEAFIAEPGARFTYSGVAYYFLQKVIESKLEKSWESLAQDFFSRVGMTHATFEQPEAGKPKNCRIARGHAANGIPEAVPAPVESAVVPAASLLTTTNDYIVFLRYCFNNLFLKSTLFSAHTSLNQIEFTKTPEAAAKISWGQGMGVFKTAENGIAFHWGDNPCSRAFCAIDMKTGDAIACFVNSVNGPNVFKTIAESVLGDLSPVFQWLSTYCSFNAQTAPSSPIMSPIVAKIYEPTVHKPHRPMYPRYMHHTHASFFKVQGKQKGSFPPVPSGMDQKIG